MAGSKDVRGLKGLRTILSRKEATLVGVSWRRATGAELVARQGVCLKKVISVIDPDRQDQQMLAEVVAWFELNFVSLREAGAEVRLAGPSSGGNKNSVEVGFLSPQLLVTVSVWDSWECDIGILDIERDPDGDIVWEVLELTGRSHIRVLLDRIAARYRNVDQPEIP